MLDFYWLEYTHKDQPWLFSVVLYTNWCNFRCFWCHNRTLAGWDYEKQTLNKWSPNIKQVSTDTYHQKLTKDEIKLAIENDFLDMVILCWWEVLIHPIKEIEETIKWMKNINPNLFIRIDTNGSFPDKVKYLKENKLVDWFAIDIKWPYWNSNYYPTIEKVIWLPNKTLKKIYSKIMDSIKIADWMKYTLFRTVIYPIVEDQEYFNEIKQFVNKNLNSKHSLNIFQNV